MEAVTNPPQQTVRSTDKLVEALATLGALLDRTINEVRAVERDFQHRLQQSVQQTEANLLAQAAHQVEATRHEVSESLTAKFKADIQAAIDSLRSEFSVERERLSEQLRGSTDAVSRLKKENSDLISELQRSRDEAETALERTRQTGAAALENLRDELTTKLRREAQSILDSVKAEYAEERHRLQKEARQGSEAGSRADAERASLLEELKQVREDALAQIEKSRREMGSKFKDDLQDTIDSINMDFAAERERFNAERQLAIAEQERLAKECDRLSDERDRLNRELKASTERANRISAEVDDLAGQIVQTRADAVAGIEQARGESNARIQKESEGALTRLKEDFDAEREKLNQELRYAMDAAAKLESERSGLLGELQRVRAQAAADIEHARSDASATARTAAELSSKAAPATRVSGKPSNAVMEEIQRIQNQLSEILKVIDDPSSELSVVIRKNVEKSELESYLKGIRYATGA